MGLVDGKCSSGLRATITQMFDHTKYYVHSREKAKLQDVENISHHPVENHDEHNQRKKNKTQLIKIAKSTQNVQNKNEHHTKIPLSRVGGIGTNTAQTPQIL